MPSPTHRRSILVTGCTPGGLGAALAEAFAETDRWRVIASARNLTKLEGWPSMTSGEGSERKGDSREPKMERVRLDICDDESVKEAVTAVEVLLKGEEVGLDALCLNAGGGLSMPLSDVTASSLNHLFHLNVTSQLTTLQAFLPLLLRSRTRLARNHNLKPTVIVHTSIAGQAYGNFPFVGAYNASKAAISQLTQCLRVELGLLGIDVVELRTGGVKSGFFETLIKYGVEGGGGSGVVKPRLPEGSLWNVDGVKEVVEGVMDGSKLDAMFEQDRGKWARRVVGDLEGGVKIIYRGSSASNVKWAERFVPRAVFDWILVRMLGLAGLSGMLREAEERRSK